MNKIKPNIEALINKPDTVSNFINTAKKWNMQRVKNVLPSYIIDKISVIPILFSNIDDKITWKFSANGDFPVKNCYLDKQ